MQNANDANMNEPLNPELIVLKTATAGPEFEDGRHLFRRYAESLDFDLAFQHFAEELETISEQYNRPTGALLLAYYGETAIGCVGIRQLEQDTAELKRLYVRPDYRRFKIGRQLMEAALHIARELNYQRIRLDTTPSQAQAQNLYRSMGFYEIRPYRHNPIGGAVFMEKKLGE